MSKENTNSKEQLKQVQKDLALTVEELSDVYEEISILYHISQSFSGLTIDDICNKLLDEVAINLDVKTVSILLLDEERPEAYTAVSTGKWAPDKVIAKGDNIIWHAIERNKPQVFCDINNTPHKKICPDLQAIMVCPLTGKKKKVGVILTGEKTSGEEFFASDSKFLMAIASQAALAIENAYLHQELEGFFFGTVMAFVKAIESRSHWTSGHSERVTRYALAIAHQMNMDRSFIERLRICGLLHDIGKIATPIEILDKRGELDDNELIEVEQHPLTGSSILSELKQFRDITDGIRYHHEKWDGNGVHEKLKGTEIPVMARIISVADAFDAMTSDRPYRKKLSFEKALNELIVHSGKQFDPDIVDAFMQVKDALFL